MDTDDQPDTSTYEGLIAAWAERDAQYAMAPRYLVQEQVTAIRLGREREADRLQPEDRARAWSRAHAWYPPEPRQGLR